MRRRDFFSLFIGFVLGSLSTFIFYHDLLSIAGVNSSTKSVTSSLLEHGSIVNNNVNILSKTSLANDDSKSSKKSGKKHASTTTGRIVTETEESINDAVKKLPPNRMHGNFARDSSGSPIWPLAEPPSSNIPIERLLREGGGFNIAVSNSISLDRDVIESRDPQCLRESSWDYSKMDATTVVIVFHNEAETTLFRSVHSVLNRTPPQLLAEIILVDDKSTLDWIKTTEEGGTGSLEAYIQHLPKTRLLRLPERKGLVAARLMGIRGVNKSKTFIILDSHIEVQHQWVEPLVSRMWGEEGRKRFVMPQIDGIQARNFKLSGGGIGCTLGFIWRLMEHGVPDQQHSLQRRQGNLGPLESPAMAGGLFGAHVDYFEEIGAYDEAFTYWGAENLELSFRIWQCGGVLECVPCSRVFHVFREGGKAYSVAPNSLTINKLRTIRVWMDEYAELTNIVLGYPSLPDSEVGDLSSRVQLRKNLKCKSFDWYLKNVWPEGYVTDASQVPNVGLIRNLGVSPSEPTVDGQGICLETRNGRPGSHAGVAACKTVSAKTDRRWMGQGFMFFSKPGHIMPVHDDEACLTADLEYEWCDHKVHKWIYDKETKQLKFTRRKEEDKWVCLGYAPSKNSTVKVKCDANNVFQKWAWDEFDLKKPRSFEN